MKCDICEREITLITTHQFNKIMFGVDTGSALAIKAGATVCNECCNKIIKFIDSISSGNAHGGIIL
jgi:hypothetical protein